MKRILSVLLVLFATTAAAVAHTIDTGTPNGSAIGALAFDSNDAYAGQVSFAKASSIQAIFAHVLGGTAGETFTVALYGDGASHLPDTLLYSATATYGVDGWNGVSGLSGWKVAAGIYWVGFEIGFADTLGAVSATGALLDMGAPVPLARTAFNPGGGYAGTATPLTFGLQLDATVVPEPATLTLIFLGLAIITNALRRGTRRPH